MKPQSEFNKGIDNSSVGTEWNSLVDYDPRPSVPVEFTPGKVGDSSRKAIDAIAEKLSSIEDPEEAGEYMLHELAKMGVRPGDIQGNMVPIVVDGELMAVSTAAHDFSTRISNADLRPSLPSLEVGVDNVPANVAPVDLPPLTQPVQPEAPRVELPSLTPDVQPEAPRVELPDLSVGNRVPSTAEAADDTQEIGGQSEVFGKLYARLQDALYGDPSIGQESSAKYDKETDEGLEQILKGTATVAEALKSGKLVSSEALSQLAQLVSEGAVRMAEVSQSALADQVRTKNFSEQVVETAEYAQKVLDSESLEREEMFKLTRDVEEASSDLFKYFSGVARESDSVTTMLRNLLRTVVELGSSRFGLEGFSDQLGQLVSSLSESVDSGKRARDKANECLGQIKKMIKPKD